MEKSENEVSNSQKTETGTLESNETSKQQMWLLENGGDAKYGNHKINNSQARIHIHARLLSNSV